MKHVVVIVFCCCGGWSGWSPVGNRQCIEKPGRDFLPRAKVGSVFVGVLKHALMLYLCYVVGVVYGVGVVVIFVLVIYCISFHFVIIIISY